MFTSHFLQVQVSCQVFELKSKSSLKSFGGETLQVPSLLMPSPKSSIQVRLFNNVLLPKFTVYLISQKNDSVLCLSQFKSDSPPVGSYKS